MALHAQEKSSTIHVLLLEDNPGDVLLIKAMLRKQIGTTYLLQREDSTEGGLTTLRTQPVDVVLLDLGLIDSKGIETLIVMQKHHRDIPMVVMTGMDDELLATEAVRQGAQDFLVKGKFDGYWLHRVIDNAIQRKELEHSLHILAQFPDNNPNPVLRISEDGQVLYANKASERLCALCDCYVNHYVQETWREWLRQAAVMKKSTTHEQELASSFFRFQIVPLPDSRQFYLYAEDITKQKRAEQQLQHSAQHDVLTNLPNRKFLLETLAQTLTQKHMMRPFAVLFLDVDRFKRVNDGLGHAVGDILLIQFAERIGKGLRDSDIVARLGGDEFVILLRDLHGPQDAIRVAERIQQALETPFQLEGHTLFVATSIGIAFGHQASKRPGDYLRDADNAMYRAKKNKNMPYAIFDKKMHAKAVERLQLEAELRHGLTNEQFVLHYQPIIDCNRGCISGFEALVRWQHPTRGLLYPDLFVPLAEESNLINTLGWWVFEAACKQLLRWQQVFDPTLRININISSRQLTAKDALSTIQQIASQSGVLPEYVGLEITETMLMEQTEEAISLLQKLKEQHFYICMDDFGTGYSSLAYLQHFPINTLKIDRSFVMDMAKGGKQRTLVRTIVSLAEHFGLDVVAEGVEQKEHLEDLKDWGCRYMQGYYFSKPIPSSEADTLLSHQTQWLLEKHVIRENI